MPDLQALHLRFAALGLKVLGVSVDDDAHLVREFLLKHPVAFPILLDSRRVLAEAQLHLESYPVSCVVGRDGMVVEVIHGARPWASPEVAERVARQAGIG